VRAHQVHLQLTNLVAGDAHVAQFAHAGGDGVGELVAGDNLVDDRACQVDCLPRVRRQQGGAAASILATSPTASSVRSFPLMCSAFKKVPREMLQLLNQRPSIMSLLSARSFSHRRTERR
jgi:hypothetical protein